MAERHRAGVFRRVPAGRRRRGEVRHRRRRRDLAHLNHATEALARHHGMLPVHISAGEVRLHMLQDVFFAMARRAALGLAAAALRRGVVHPQWLRMASAWRRPDDDRTRRRVRRRRQPAGAQSRPMAQSRPVGRREHGTGFSCRHAAPVLAAAGAGGRTSAGIAGAAMAARRENRPDPAAPVRHRRTHHPHQRARHADLALPLSCARRGPGGCC